MLWSTFRFLESGRAVVVRARSCRANAVINRSYGVWIAMAAQVSVLHNRIHNMHHGITLATDAEAIVAHNEITVDPPPAGATTKSLETDGVAATGAKRVVMTGNRIEGQSQPVALPSSQPSL